MDLAEFIKRFREEFKAVEGMYEEPTERELVLMFISIVVLAKFQRENIKEVLMWLRNYLVKRK